MPLLWRPNGRADTPDLGRLSASPLPRQVTWRTDAWTDAWTDAHSCGHLSVLKVIRATPHLSRRSVWNATRIATRRSRCRLVPTPPTSTDFGPRPSHRPGGCRRGNPSAQPGDRSHEHWAGSSFRHLTALQAPVRRTTCRSGDNADHRPEWTCGPPTTQSNHGTEWCVWPYLLVQPPVTMSCSPLPPFQCNFYL